MFNILRYQRYNDETKIALMDNSTIAFMEQMERLGISAKEVLRGYNKILIPNWVLEEVQDSVYRERYIENGISKVWLQKSFLFAALLKKIILILWMGKKIIYIVLCMLRFRPLQQ